MSASASRLFKYVLYTPNQLPSMIFLWNSVTKTLSQAGYIARPIWPAYLITSPSTLRLTTWTPMWINKHYKKWRWIILPFFCYQTLILCIQGYGQIIGVSKCCCPACSNFLQLISAAPDKQPFLVWGSHSNVTACTLLPWTPSHIVDLMVNIFEDQLRKDLIALMLVYGSRTFSDRGHAASKASQTLFIDSNLNKGQNSKQIFNPSDGNALHWPIHPIHWFLFILITPSHPLGVFSL